MWCEKESLPTYMSHKDKIGIIGLGYVGLPLALEFSKKKKVDKNNRLFSKKLGGGSILDLGCYPVSFSCLIASIISKIDYDKIKKQLPLELICNQLNLIISENTYNYIKTKITNNLEDKKYIKVFGVKKTAEIVGVEMKKIISRLPIKHNVYISKINPKGVEII